MDFDLLPLEIRYNIFSFLSKNELRTIVANVSKNWRHISKSPHFKKCLTFDYESANEIRDRINKNYRICTLKMSYITVWNWTSDILPREYLRDLTFTSCTFESKNLLSQFIKKLPNLQHLRILFCHFENNDCMDSTLLCKSLKYLNFYVTHRYVRSNICSCLDFVSNNCESIQELDFTSYSTIAERSIIKFRDQNGDKLKKVTFLARQLLFACYQLFAKQQQLTHLNISSAHAMTTRDLLEIRNLTQLQSLSVTSCINLPTNSYIDLFKETTYPYLKYVWFSICHKLSDETIDVIISSCPVLETLQLDECNVSARKIKEICERMKGATAEYGQPDMFLPHFLASCKISFCKN